MSSSAQSELASGDSDLRSVDVVRVGGKYRLKEQIGAGSFGIVYHAVNVISKEDVAIKLEPIDVENPQLQYEHSIYKSLAGVIGIPSVRWFGTEGDYNAMVLELLGPSLEELFNRNNRKFSLKTILILADQMISCIENVHSRHYIHGDVKPANFLMGLGAHESEVYIIDFGLAGMYRDRKTHLHIPYKENCHPIGTPPFASINNHLGVERSRRDDMESLAYILIYFLCGSLPWSGIKLAMDMKWHKETLQRKMGSPLDLLGSAYPNEFSVFLSYTRALRFDEKPDYTYIRKIFRELLLRTEYQHSLTRDSPDAHIAGARAKNDKRKVQQVKDMGCLYDGVVVPYSHHL